MGLTGAADAGYTVPQMHFQFGCRSQLQDNRQWHDLQIELEFGIPDILPRADGPGVLVASCQWQ